MNRALFEKVLAEHGSFGWDGENGHRCRCAQMLSESPVVDSWRLWVTHVATALEDALCDPQESGVCMCGDDLEHHTSEHNFVDSETAALAAQEGERGGAEVAADIGANDGHWAAFDNTGTGDFVCECGLPWTEKEGCAFVQGARAALADPAGALATHDAEVLRAYADSIMAEVAVWDENVYPNRWDKAREKARHARERADRIEARS